MQIAILGNGEGWHCKDLLRAATDRGHRCRAVDFSNLTACEAADRSPLASGDWDLSHVDAVIVRTMPPGSLEQVVFRMDALARLEASGITVMNPPRAIECAVDKYITTSRLSSAGLTVPDTIVCEDPKTAMDAFVSLGGDVVVKPLFGSEGRGIIRLSDLELARRTFRALEQISAVLYVQRFVDHNGGDVRVMVLDDQVLGGMARRCGRDFRTNISQHGTAQPHLVTDQERDVAIQAARVTGCRVAGIDLLYDRQGRLYVIEVNSAPGWQAFRRVTGCDVADFLIRSLESV